MSVCSTSSMFSPHGICLLWEPELIWLHVASDAVIAAAYFSIPVALSIFVSKRRDVDFGWIFWAFALFIMACGFTHILSIITLWVPIYGIEGHRQGADGCGLDRHRGDAMAAVAESPCAAVPVPTSRGRAGAGAGRHAPARGREHAPAVAEDGSDRTIDRRRSARFQQSAHHHQRQSGDRRAQPAILGRARRETD